ncbi:zinc ribbon domain-containing protein [Deinococcus metallilatus]|nr:zinc ribbon domain-containing protein [Deinococcus metallilatus]MBB5296616.1 hypothetical protein [Deinococcus metallilatus]
MDQKRQRRHVLRVDRRSYAQLQAAVQQGLLLPCDTVVGSMRNGTVYRPAPWSLQHQQLLDDDRLQLGDLVIQGAMTHVPAPEFRALVQASPTYMTYPGLAPLVQQLRDQTPAFKDDLWQAGLRAAVAAGRVTVGVNGTVVGPGPAYRWLPQETRLTQHLGHWFVLLAFEAEATPRTTSTLVAGVDVGLNPLATAVCRDVAVAGIRRADLRGLRIEERLLGEHLLYAAARGALCDLTKWLAERAGVVVVEHLDLTTFASRYPQRSREHALTDWQMSWLPQELHARGIRLARVDPARTSQMCSVCPSFTLGTRVGRVFECPNGHQIDAHINAAQNIIRRWWATRRRAHQA